MAKKRKARKIASRVHNYVNHRRADHGLKKLSGSSKLSSIAEDYAHEMAKRDHIGHHVDGSKPKTRARGFSGVSENCGMVHDRGRSPGSIAGHAVKMWMDSSGHRANILREGSKVDGVGCWISNGKVYLCHNFARKGAVSVGPVLNDVPEAVIDRTSELVERTGRISERALETPWAPLRALDASWWRVLPERRQRSFTLGIAVALIAVWFAQQEVLPPPPSHITVGTSTVPTVAIVLGIIAAGEAVRWSR